MHLPDGFIDAKTAVTAAALATVGVGAALRQVQRQMPARKIPLLGLAAAFLFAAQMINFPVIGGTSGHLMGGTLVAALLGPSAAVLVLVTVLTVQCLLFADGGVLALGANIFNMALLAPAAGYAAYRLISCWLPGMQGRVTAVAFGGWCSTVLASISCAGQLAWSGVVPWRAGVMAMSGVHVLIGIGEGLISALVLLAVHRTRPEIITEAALPASQRWADLARYGLLACLGLAVFVVPFACSWPDGLERVAAELGFASHSTETGLPALAPDYHFPGLTGAVAATVAAGLVGTVVAFGLAWLLGRMLVPNREGFEGS
jgi:cobalt/nickel transport system permease protein